MKKNCCIVVLLIIGASIVQSKISNAGVVGVPVPDLVASDLRGGGGGCTGVDTITCEMSGGETARCSAKNVIVLDQAGDPRSVSGDLYCGGGSSCSSYWKYTASCCN